MTTRHSLLAVLTAAIWGFNFVVIQWGMVGVPPLLFVAVRFLVVAAPAVLLLAPRPPVALWKIAAVGTFLSLGPVRVPLRSHRRRHAGRAGLAGPPVPGGADHPRLGRSAA